MRKYRRIYELAAEFDNLCIALLEIAGFSIQVREGTAEHEGRFLEFDFLGRHNDSGQRMVIEWKLGTARDSLYEGAKQAAAARDWLGVDGALFITAVDVPAQMRTIFENELKVQVWDRQVILRMVDKIQELKARYEVLWEEIVSESRTAEAAETLLQKLSGITAGKDGWQRYEEICSDILTYVFSPPLSNPAFHSRSGINIRDLVFGIRPGHSFWDQVSAHYKTRIVVAEFKNLQTPPGQDEVLCLIKYLFRRAMRSFGLLVSRQPPSASALVMRRTAWLEGRKIILFLSDQDLSTLVRLRAEGQEPSQLLDFYLDDFFRTLEA